MKLLQGASLLVLAGGLIGLSMSVFTVDQTQQAIVLQLGQPVGEVKEPGLHFKVPFVQTVREFDRRILSVDPDPEQMVISSRAIAKAPAQPAEDTENEEEGFAAPSIDSVTGEPIVVDSFARYKIVEPLQFLKTLGTPFNANSRLKNILSDATKAVLGKTTLEELLSSERAAVMDEIQARVNKSIANDQLGIEIIDVRIVRADLTPELRQSTVRRMISELQERATETRAVGDEKALEIRSKADKERTVILAEAERDAQIIRGKGDQTAIKTYADAFNKDAEFYDFMRSMEAYGNTLATPDTRLILSPDSQFFKHFKTIE
ncbi:MAG TPA: protease modulator HflC [Micavibrio sp.]|nr:protease modulator HflC [Micavibrio sp.]HIL29732.1 protease modulator HflC [Micavibrio sp.]